ncbi:MAG TPA: hypothetical protein VH062_07390 [Polyangiaceae bacterium]|jgi:hypothetical protein|nr:hypothetical protein [Polyangiaceae bacterium]
MFDRPDRRLLGAAFAVLATLAATGCVDKEKCDEAIKTTRDALAKDQPDLARQWRDRAWKICNDSTQTSPLDKEITDKEAELAKRVTDAAKQAAEGAQLRLNEATGVWKAYDALDIKDKTEAKLDQYKTSAGRMTQGLPAEYAKQVEDYNAQQYSRRLAVAQAAAKK